MIDDYLVSNECADICLKSRCIIIHHNFGRFVYTWPKAMNDSPSTESLVMFYAKWSIKRVWSILWHLYHVVAIRFGLLTIVECDEFHFLFKLGVCSMQWQKIKAGQIDFWVSIIGLVLMNCISRSRVIRFIFQRENIKKTLMVKNCI